MTIEGEEVAARARSVWLTESALVSTTAGHGNYETVDMAGVGLVGCCGAQWLIVRQRPEPPPFW
jgi:hypothetical protein